MKSVLVWLGLLWLSTTGCAQQSQQKQTQNNAPIERTETLRIKGDYIECWACDKSPNADIKVTIQHDTLKQIKETIIWWPYIEDGKYEHIQKVHIEGDYIEINK